jgi:hypothetical protein
MYIIAKDKDGYVQYLNPDHFVRFSVEEKAVFAWTPDNLNIELEKTKELKEQLDKLSAVTTKGFEKFN